MLRTANLQQRFGPSSQIQFYPQENVNRVDTKEIEMHHTWTRKRAVTGVSGQRTHDKMFGAQTEGHALKKWYPERAEHIRQCETRDRGFNILSHGKHVPV